MIDTLDDIAYNIKLLSCGAGAEILEKAESVVPSQIGDEKWNRFASSYDPSKPGTSCPWLVHYAMKPWFDTKGGLSSMRDEAKKIGAWVDGKSDKTPCPGSGYLLEEDWPGGEIRVVHVGIVARMTKKYLFTIDSGLGIKPHQKADKVKRDLERQGNTIYLTFLGKRRRFAGWVDPRKLSKKNWFTQVIANIATLREDE